MNSNLQYFANKFILPIALKEKIYILKDKHFDKVVANWTIMRFFESKLQITSHNSLLAR